MDTSPSSGDSGISADIHHSSSDENKDGHTPSKDGRTPSKKFKKNRSSSASANHSSSRVKKSRDSSTSVDSIPLPSDLIQRRGSNASTDSSTHLCYGKNSGVSSPSADSNTHSSDLIDSRSSTMSTDTNPYSLKNVDPNAEKWCHVVAEIVETELDHHKGIAQIVDAYLSTSHGRSVFTEDEIEQIFSNIEDICFHSEFVASQMMDCTDDPYELCLIFVDQREKFIDLYGHYVANFPQALSALHDAEQRPQVSKHLKKAEARHKRRLSLQSELIRPIQRILKYPLLLKELRKSVGNTDGKEDNRITAAVESMSSVAIRINEIKAEQEQYAEIQSRFVKWKYGSLANYGPLILEGPLKEVGSSVTHYFMPKERHAFLFRSLFVLGKPRDKDKTITVKSVIKLSELGCTEVIDNDDAHCFQLVQMTSLANSHILSGVTTEDSKKWYELIRNTLIQDTDLDDGVRKILDKDEQAVTSFQSLCSEAVESGRRATLIAKAAGIPSVNMYTEDDEESDDENCEMTGFLPPYFSVTDLSPQLPPVMYLKSSSVVTVDSLSDDLMEAIANADFSSIRPDPRSVQGSTTSIDIAPGMVAATTSSESLDTPIPIMAYDDEFERPVRPARFSCPSPSSRPFTPPLAPLNMYRDADSDSSCSEQSSAATNTDMDDSSSLHPAAWYPPSLEYNTQSTEVARQPSGGVRSSQSSSSVARAWESPLPAGQVCRSESLKKENGVRPSSSLGNLKCVNVTIGAGWSDVELKHELQNKTQKEESSKKPKLGKMKMAKDISASTTPAEAESPYAIPPGSIRNSLERVRTKLLRSRNGNSRSPRRDIKSPLMNSPVAMRAGSAAQDRALPPLPQANGHVTRVCYQSPASLRSPVPVKTKLKDTSISLNGSPLPTRSPCGSILDLEADFLYAPE